MKAALSSQLSKARETRLKLRNGRPQPSRLFLVNFDNVVVLHLQGLGRIIVVYPFAVKEETQRRDRHALTLTVRFLQFAHRRGKLDLEVNFAVVLTNDFEANVLRGRLISATVSVSHDVSFKCHRRARRERM